MSKIPALLSLPSELILSVTLHLNHHSILALRQTCIHLSKTLTFPLKDRQKRLYLHPKSIGSAIDLLNSSSEWKNAIHEIVILGYCSPGLKTRPRDGGLEDRLDYKVWDQIPAELTQLSYEDVCELEGKGFAECYAELLQGLRELPALKSLIYADSASKCGLGFCAVSDATIYEHAKWRERWQFSFGGEGQPSLRQALRTKWWGDGEVLCAVLDAVQEKLENIEILARIPAIEHIEPPWSYGVNVKRVRVLGPGQGGWEKFLFGLFGCMKNIESLEVDICSQIDEDCMARRRNLPFAGEVVLWEEESGWIDRFDPSQFASEKLRRVVIRNDGYYPYSMNDTGILTLLEDHMRTLEEVELRNILPCGVSMVGLEGAGIPEVWDLEEGIRSVVSFVRRMSDLRSAVMRIRRVGCVGTCEAGEGLTGHDSACHVFPIKDRLESVEVLVDLAEEFAINLHKGEEWIYMQLQDTRH